MGTLAQLEPAKANRKADPLPTQVSGRHGYSLAKVIRTLCEDRKPLDGVEGEAHRELSLRLGRACPQSAHGLGAYIPLDAPLQQRAFDTTAGVGGMLSQNMGTVVDALRARLITARMGARTLEDLHGQPFLPRRTTAASLGWFTEGVAAPLSTQQVTEQVKFSPKSTGVRTEITRFAKDLVIPDVLDVFVSDAMAGLAVEIDRVALNGTGAAGGVNEPLGILHDATVPTVSFGAAGAAPSAALLASMKSVLGLNNGDDGTTLAFVTTPNCEATLRTTPRNGPGSLLLLDGQNFVLGCPFASTTNIPHTFSHGAGTGLSAAILGSWAALTIGLWPLYLMVDPYKQSTSGVIVMTFFQDVDVQLLQKRAFVTALDIVAP